MWNFFNSFAASSRFEKHRLELTARNYDQPSEPTLRIIMKTFNGEDPETKAQIAFATIVKKLVTSDSRQNWIYLIKNLIILDRVIGERVFIQDISQAQFDSFDLFRETDFKYAHLQTERMIKVYWTLIHSKSNLLKSKQHIFCYRRGQRQTYLSSLSPFETLREIDSIAHFFQLVFNLIHIFSGKRLLEQRPDQRRQITKSRQQFNSSKLLEYIYLQMLHKLMLYYSCQMLCTNHFLQLLIKSQKDVNIEQIKRFRRCIVKFKAQADEFILFVECNKKIKGFEEINYRELNPFPKEEMLSLIDKLLQVNAKSESEAISRIDYIGELVMKVEKQPSTYIPSAKLIPRRKIKRSTSLYAPAPSIELEALQRRENNAFTDWTNSYSSEFPQKEIMTLDLITLLNKEADGHEEEPTHPQRTENMIFYDLRETNITVNYEVCLKQEEEKNQTESLSFKNIFSGLPFTWNHD